MADLIETRLEDDGILLAIIDMPGRTMNVFSAALMDSLEALIERVEEEPSVRGLVITSGKPAFLAGADLSMIREFTERALTDTPEAMHALCGRLGRLFRRLELVPKPTAAAVNGLALGGGLELVMACHYRVASNDPRAVLGLPEVNLGLLPGAGGTQRLPRLVGAKEGLRMLLSGAPVNPERALELGLVDALAEAGAVVERAKAAIREGEVTRPRWDRAGFVVSSEPYDFSDREVIDTIAADLGISETQRADYPAYNAILNCVVGGWDMPLTEGSEWEMKQFLTLMFDPVAGNMVRSLFLNRQRAEKAFEKLVGAPAAKISLAGEGAFVEALRGEFEKAARKASEASGAGAGEILLRAGGKQGADAFCLLNGLGADTVGPGVYIGPKTRQGRVVEIFNPQSDERALREGLWIAKTLRATPFVNEGGKAFLPRLEAARGDTGDLQTVADAANALKEAGQVPDPELADMAAVLAGLVPACAGGPFAWLAQRG